VAVRLHRARKRLGKEIEKGLPPVGHDRRSNPDEGERAAP
jgi:hypothetical protein